jgi:DNA helicase-2/ATP-dependent DNA helicase PcrA
MSDAETYPTLADFLEHVSLVIDNEYNDNANKVIVSTLHAAKGLEFDAVFLPGWEEGIFPHQKCLDCGDDGSIEEERRLAYVAITRAKKFLFISMAFNRKLYGQWQSYPPSRFLNELPPSCIELKNHTGYGTPQPKQNYNSGNYGGAKTYYKNNDSYQGRGYHNSYQKSEKHGYFDSYESAAYDTYEDEEYGYKKPSNDYFYQQKKVSPLVGTKVFHPSFGYGKILNVEGDKCEVFFDKVGKKKIMGSFLEKC